MQKMAEEAHEESKRWKNWFEAEEKSNELLRKDLAKFKEVTEANEASYEEIKKMLLERVRELEKDLNPEKKKAR